jgi:hypothetical protein
MSNVPAELVDLALDALDDEVKRWRKMPWAPGRMRLMRFSLITDPIGPAEVPPPEEQTVTYHDIPTAMADDMILPLAMEKVVETVIGAVSVSE